MFYRIKINLPKSRIKQYAEPLPISVSKLSTQDFLNLVNGYQNCITLSSALNRLKLNNQKVTWDNPTTEQLNILADIYTQNPIGFADQSNNPGENNTLSVNEGRIALQYINNNKTAISNSYERIGLKPLPFLRLLNQNIKLPNMNNINPQYVLSYETNVTPELFGQILKELQKEGKLLTPLTYNSYKFFQPKLFVYNNKIYKLPDHKELDAKKDTEFRKVFYQVKNEYHGDEKNIERFEDNFDAWQQFLIDNKSNMNAVTFNKIKNEYPQYFSEKNGQTINYYTYKDSSYFFIPSFRLITDTLKSIYFDVIVDGRPSTNSLGNKVLQKVRDESTIQNLLPAGLVFKTEFRCKNDPRFEEFIKNNIDKGRGRNMLLYLFSSIKGRKTEKIKPDGTTLHCFNLSTILFENIPKIEKGWVEKKESGEIHEFELSCNHYDSNQDTCTEWQCTTYIPKSDGSIDLKTTFIKDTKFLPERYSFDAVIVDQNDQVVFVLEFDGVDHYFARSGNDCSNKIVSDQIKENFCKSENITSIRVPYFSSYKGPNFESKFEAFVIDIINKWIGNYNTSNQTTPENINPAVREIPAYKIRKMIN